MLIFTYSIFVLKGLKKLRNQRVKIRYTKGGMKTDLITMKAKQKSIEEKKL